MIFHCHKLVPAILFRNVLHVLELVTVHGGRTDCPHLSLFNQVIKSFHCFFDWMVIVKAVNDVEV